MNNEALTVREETPANNSGGFLQIIDRVVGNGEMTTEKVAVLERLLAMQMTVREEERKAAFADALCVLQAECPQIEKNGIIYNKDKVTVRSRYSLIEDIDLEIRPLLQKHGFSVSYNEESATGDNYRISCKLLHRDGHSETKYITLPLDKNEYRTRMQDRKSTESFAHRNLLLMHLNIISKGEDNDGQGSGRKITDDQCKDLLVLMDEVKQDMPRFFKHFGIEKVSDLPEKELQGVIRDLERKRK